MQLKINLEGISIPFRVPYTAAISIAFGTILVSRPAGKEAWLAFQPVLNGVAEGENITVDFTDVVVSTPSWADEFLTPLKSRFGDRVVLYNTDNPSIKATLEMLV